MKLRETRIPATPAFISKFSESNDLLTEIATVLVSASNTEDLSSFNPAIQKCTMKLHMIMHVLHVHVTEDATC